MKRHLWLLLAISASAEDAAAIRRDLARERVALAEECDKDGLVEEAARERLAAGGSATGAPPYVLDWSDDLHAKYLTYVKRRDALLDVFARRWLDAGDPESALFLRPDFAPAREKLGEVLAGGAWVPRADADRMLEDLLPIGGKWLPADEVRRRRATWAEAWEVRDGRFLVRSNRSPESVRAVLELAAAVHTAVYRELCGRVDPPPRKPLPVYDFATRADFLAHLDAAHDGGGTHRDSPGFFSSADGASHFAPLGAGTGFADVDVARHEIAHQVCDAIWPPEGMLAERPHFWAWEGVAGFFESVQVRDGKVLVGSRYHPRLAVALRALQDGRTLPLEEFVLLDGDRIRGRYNQAAALAHFFLMADRAKHRAAFLRYFDVVARGKAEKETFSKAFGREPGEFQEAWEAWVKGDRPAVPAAADEAALRKAAARARAALGQAAWGDGLVEEAIREWQLALRDDPANAEASGGLSKSGKPWVLAWDEGTHAKYKAWLEKRKRAYADLAGRWAALAAGRDAAGDRDGAWAACQEAFAFDPDCAEARARLGEKKFEGAWVPEEEAVRRGKGLLPIGGEWLPADEVRRRRSKWDEAWEVEGPHYRVRSNRSLASARGVLARAEDAHAAFSREILGVVDPPPLPKKMPVLDFATLEDLQEHCRREHGGEGAAPKNVPGFFTPGEGAAHFGPLPEGSVLSRDDVVRHECTHQASDSAFPAKGWMNVRPGFWAWEGLASYFESVESRQGKILAGDPSHVRFALGAKEAREGKLKPLAQFVLTTQETLAHDYQQAAVLAHFFLHAGGGKYRERFIAYFEVVARGESDKGTFEKEFGKGPAEFEEEFSRYARELK
ncbi:MAG: hypothetical protein HYY18_09495 [Planctomycetes bacterium]|nr:hypothetical protein [Planctomycetota bacterium]